MSNLHTAHPKRTRQQIQETRAKKWADEYYMWFILAREFGQDPFELMNRWTERQFQAAVAWYKDTWNNPERLEYYIMQLTAILQAVNSKNPGSVSIDKLKIKFRERKRVTGKQSGFTKEQLSAISKARWLGLMTMPVTTRTPE